MNKRMNEWILNVCYLVKDDIPPPDGAGLEDVLQGLRDPVVHLLPDDLDEVYG